MQAQTVFLKGENNTRLTKLKRDNGWNNNSGARRGRLEIIAEILLFCDRQKAKTSIMYKANLNYAQMKKHLKDLTLKSLVTQSNGKYITTEKGYRFLELFAQLNNMLNT
jgi:predicted transcriptional regulator